MKKWIFLFATLLVMGNIYSQTFDLGVVWEKNNYTDPSTMRGSAINHIIRQQDGNYLAVGWTMKKGDTKALGYILHINEGGDVIGDYVISPPQVAQWTTGAASCALMSAHITNDGNIIAFGHVTNATAVPNTLKLDPATPTSAWLSDGLWKVSIKLKSDKSQATEINSNVLEKGCRVGGVAVHKKGEEFIVFGHDAYLPGPRTLVRVYDKSGSIVYDNKDGGRVPAKDVYLHWINTVDVTDNGNYAIGTNVYGVREINSTTFQDDSELVKQSAWDIATCILRPTVLHWGTPDSYYTVKKGGGAWVMGRMAGTPDNSENLGSFFLERDASGNILDCSSNPSVGVPGEINYQANNDTQTIAFNRPFLLPASNNSYVGTKAVSGVNKMYVVVDNPSPGVEFLLNEGPQYPYNTAVKEVSHTDGFFSGGQDPTTKMLAISKLSTCVNFKVSDEKMVSDIFLYNNSVTYNVNKDINYVGAKTNDVAYTLIEKVVKGTVNGKVAGTETILASNLTMATLPTAGAGKVLNFNQTYSTTDAHAEVEYTLTLHNRYQTGSISQQCNPPYTFKVVISKPTSSLFSDNIWFFGQNVGAAENTSQEGTPETSKGIEFKQDASGNYYPTNLSGVSKVNSFENSLSVSTPACEGSFIFYTQHDRVYNSEHKYMKSRGVVTESDWGKIAGHTSTGDGLAAAYIGDNKYVLFSTSNQYQLGELYYYIIDMNGDNGNGELITPSNNAVNGANKTNEAIELIPKAGTTNEYWLIFCDYTKGKVKVMHIDGSKDNPVGEVVDSLNHPFAGYATPPADPNGFVSITFKIFANKSYDRVAMVERAGLIYMFSFNPLIGKLDLLYEIDERSTPEDFSTLYGAEFSPNGEYIYAACHSFNDQVYQYDVATGTRIGHKQFTTLPTATLVFYGGGMKLGPDGKIYIKKSLSEYMSIIPEPNKRFDADGTLIIEGFEFVDKSGNKYNGGGLGVSTGITPPWINPDDSNLPPIAENDKAITTKFTKLEIDVLANDYDQDDNSNATLKITAVWFANSADALKGEVKITDDKKKVIFIPNFAHNFTNNEIIKLGYSVQDAGTPVKLCAEGQIEVTIKQQPYPSSTLFNDDVWYFSNNKGVGRNDPDQIGNQPLTSKAIVFKTDKNGNKIPTVPSKTSMVSSWENSLSVSTPACEGGVIFYASHNQIFNSEHVKMSGGNFSGNFSTADGLAAAYIGDNKYAFFAISEVGKVNNPELNYYIIDMAGDGGNGSMSHKGKIGTDSNVAESLELIPRVDTYNQYWLLYTNWDNKLKVFLIDFENNNIEEKPGVDLPANDVGYDYFTYKLVSDKSFTNLALTGEYMRKLPTLDHKGRICLFNFNPATGEIVYRDKIESGGNTYGAEFSPNGKYVYICHYSAVSANNFNNNVMQYDFETATLVAKSKFAEDGVTYTGGGMKLGPDERIYITREDTENVAIIQKPNEVFSVTNEVDMEGLKLITPEGLKLDGYGVSFSTGLTPPWIDPVESNKAPIANPDHTITYEGMSVKLNVVANDIDENPATLWIASVDSIDGKIHVVKTLKEVTFNFQNKYTPKKDSIAYFAYTIRDDGTPVQKCDESSIALYISKVGNISLKDSCSFDPKLYVELIKADCKIVWELANKKTPSAAAADWDVVTGNNSTTLNLKGKADGEYIYRYKIKSDDGESYYSESTKIKIETTKVANNKWYNVVSK